MRKLCVHVSRHPGLLLLDLPHQTPEHSLQGRKASARPTQDGAQAMSSEDIDWLVGTAAHTCLNVLYLHHTKVRSDTRREGFEGIERRAVQAADIM